MREVIPEEVLRGFAQTATYEELPRFVAEKREYAKQMMLALPARSEEQRKRSEQIRRTIQAVATPGVPNIT